MTTEKIAFVTGITGQDGAYLAELLLDKGYIVHGLRRRSSTDNTSRLHRLLADQTTGNARLQLHYGDLTDSSALSRLVAEIRPDEVYNLAAQSHVKVSFELPEYTGDSSGLGAIRLLEAIRLAGLVHHTRYYQASTSEIYGNSSTGPQSETTPFHPRSPYAIAKLYAFWSTVNYRESYGMHASNGILFNHESPLRGDTFVTRKITLAAVDIHLGRQKTLQLGNLSSRRDWGHARDYVEGMWRIVQHFEGGDYVLATGETHTVREFVELAFREVGINIVWEGEGLAEVGRCERSGDVLIQVDPRFFRPAEVDLLVGDPTKARQMLGWRHTVDFPGLVAEMVAADLKRATEK